MSTLWSRVLRRGQRLFSQNEGLTGWLVDKRAGQLLPLRKRFYEDYWINSALSNPRGSAWQLYGLNRKFDNIKILAKRPSLTLL